MTQISPPSPQAATTPSPPRRLVRLPDQGKWAGVAAGLGWYFGIDPALFRVAFVILGLTTGGAAAIAYIALVILLPKASVTSSGLQAPPPPSARPKGVAVLLVVAGLVLLGSIGVSRVDVLLAAVLIGLGILLFSDGGRSGRGAALPWQRAARGWWDGWGQPDDRAHGQMPPPPRQGQQPTTAYGAPYAASQPAPAPWSGGPPWMRGACGPGRAWGRPEPAETSTTAGPTVPADQDAPGAAEQPETDPGGAAPTTDPGPSGPWVAGPGRPGPRAAGRHAQRRAPRERSALGVLTIGVWLLTLGSALLLDQLGAVSLTAATGAALTLVVLGGGLLIGARWGRARSLIPLGLIATLVLGASSAWGAFATGPLNVGDGLGERRYTPVEASQELEFSLFAGEMVIDLTQLPLTADELPTVTADLTFGELTIIVPDGVGVRARGDLRAGEYSVFGASQDGTGLDFDIVVDEREGADLIELDTSVMLGQITIEQQEAQ